MQADDFTVQNNRLLKQRGSALTLFMKTVRNVQTNTSQLHTIKDISYKLSAFYISIVSF